LRLLRAYTLFMEDPMRSDVDAGTGDFFVAVVDP
jgi:hypothetical protein